MKVAAFGRVLVNESGTPLIGTPKEIRVDVDIDVSWTGAFAAKDVVGNDDCCTTTGTYWTFPDIAASNGGYFYITGATLFNETENQAVQYDLLLFNAAPTGALLSGAANTNPVKADIAKFLGKIYFLSSTANGATVATTSEVSPSTIGGLPVLRKCATGVADIYAVLVTNTAYTQTNGDTISITLFVEQY